MTELEKAIQRLEALLRLRGQSMSPVLVSDIERVIEAAEKTITVIESYACSASPNITLGINPWCTETGQNACSCSDRPIVLSQSEHERDSSVVCPYCRSQGYRGHMERTVTQ